MRPILLAAAFGLFALPAAAQSTGDQAAQPAATPAPQESSAMTPAAADATATPPTPRYNMIRSISDDGGYSGCSHRMASPVS
ncbi:hypothetical protein DLJ53_15475 [Acuticoccus sediminis]|uniref:Uncharacterized protein n=1 Tax=Acuticoccus sediminis TaxID=2184697 RepID=A0A8B2NLV7_9HYPH|nr:hypothetical protein [Acuticoccus sediminis]RAI00656.1 hypothetical protein DLJ53_15475 [Acuticoccus sediminis]